MLVMYAHLRGVPTDKINELVQHTIESLNLGNWADKMCGTYRFIKLHFSNIRWGFTFTRSGFNRAIFPKTISAGKIYSISLPYFISWLTSHDTRNTLKIGNSRGDGYEIIIPRLCCATQFEHGIITSFTNDCHSAVVITEELKRWVAVFYDTLPTGARIIKV